MRGSARAGWIVVVALVAVMLAAAAIVGLARPGPATSPSAAVASLADACRLPASDPKAGGPLSWRLVVRMDAPQESDALFVAGWARLLCTAVRAPDGGFGSVTTSMGGSPADPSTDGALTYETGTTRRDGSPYQADLIVGRMPPSTASIDITTSDGEHRNATLGDGWYMAYTGRAASASVTAIVARDAAGGVIARLADPNGVEPGATTAAN